MKTAFYYATLTDLQKTVDSQRISPYPEALRFDWDLAIPFSAIPNNVSARILKLVWLTTRELEYPKSELMQRAEAVNTPEAFLSAMSGLVRIAVPLDSERDISWKGYQRICELDSKILNAIEDRMVDLGWGPEFLLARPGKVLIEECSYIEKWTPNKGWERTENPLHNSMAI